MTDAISSNRTFLSGGGFDTLPSAATGSTEFNWWVPAQNSVAVELSGGQMADPRRTTGDVETGMTPAIAASGDSPILETDRLIAGEQDQTEVFPAQPAEPGRADGLEEGQVFQISDEASVARPKFITKKWARVAIIGAEAAPPISGPLRYGALALALTQTRDPAIGGAVLGLSTLGLEYASYRAALGWLADDSFRSVYEGIPSKWSEIRQRVSDFRLQQREKDGGIRWDLLIPPLPNIPIPKLPEKAQMNLPTQALLAVEAGTVPLLATKQLIEKDRDEQTIKRDGRVAMAFITGVLAIQGAAITEGAELFLKYTDVAVAGLGGAGLGYALLRYFKAKRNARKGEG